MRKFCIAYLQVYILKVILYYLTQMHTVGMHVFRENSGSPDVKNLKITDLGEFLSSTSRARLLSLHIGRWIQTTHLYT